LQERTKMDLASLRSELTAPGIPPLVKGWSNEEFFKLLEMYGNKCTLATMVAHFQRTRGQVSGVLHRARAKGFIEQINPSKLPNMPQQAKPEKPKVDPVTVRESELVKRLMQHVQKKKRVRLRLIEDQNQVTFAELEPHHCRWPIGEPRLPDFRFCGCRRVEGKPYCAEHVIRAGKMYEAAPTYTRSIRPSYNRR
jgi:GcrA cell cycle regulator